MARIYGLLSRSRLRSYEHVSNVKVHLRIRSENVNIVNLHLDLINEHLTILCMCCNSSKSKISEYSYFDGRLGCHMNNPPNSRLYLNLH